MDWKPTPHGTLLNYQLPARWLQRLDNRLISYVTCGREQLGQAAVRSRSSLRAGSPKRRNEGLLYKIIQNDLIFLRKKSQMSSIKTPKAAKAAQNEKRCSEWKTLLGMKTVAQNMKSCQKVAEQLVDSPNPDHPFLSVASPQPVRIRINYISLEVRFFRYVRKVCV